MNEECDATYIAKIPNALSALAKVPEIQKKKSGIILAWCNSTVIQMKSTSSIIKTQNVNDGGYSSTCPSRILQRCDKVEAHDLLATMSTTYTSRI
jgi:hypothetical protein